MNAYRVTQLGSLSREYLEMDSALDRAESLATRHPSIAVTVWLDGYAVAVRGRLQVPAGKARGAAA